MDVIDAIKSAMSMIAKCSIKTTLILTTLIIHTNKTQYFKYRDLTNYFKLKRAIVDLWYIGACWED